MDSFSVLEDKVRKAAALVRELRQRNAGLEQEVPELRSVGLGHEVACHLPADEQRRIWAELVKTQLAPAGPAEEA